MTASYPAFDPDQIYDLLVIGGGINGVGIARDATGRGLRVLLVERDDLASHTSSASTKLIHGGLRYLEYYEFRLVRESLQERERLIRIAPQISWPLRFVLPQPEGGRPGWMIRIGLFLYDHIAGRHSLPKSHGVNLRDPQWGKGLKPGLSKGFVYSDAWVDDARLVVLNAIDAAQRGATILTGTAVTGAEQQGDAWAVTLEPNADAPLPAIAAPCTVRARTIVNAAGPWVASMLGSLSGAQRDGAIKLVKGSHIVVPRVYPGDHAFILQQDDGRIVFTIPYEGEFTLVGTTDVAVGEEERARPKISTEEIAYLCAASNRYFERQIAPADVVWTYSGVRPLFDDGQEDAKAVTRDYVLKLGRAEGPQVLSVFGGKLTTYRRLAEHALDDLRPWMAGSGEAWTDNVPLPGGDLGTGGFAAFLQQARERWPFVPAQTMERMAHAYGTRIAMILGETQGWQDLGSDFGGGLTEAEVRYLQAYEWARSAEDVLWRRSKLGLTAAPDMAEKLAFWFKANAIANA